MNTCQCVSIWTGSYCQTPGRILWPFDYSLQDLYNNFIAVGVNGPTYSSPGITGYGPCLYLTGASSQAAVVTTPPFLNMAYTSFSLLAWVYATTLHNTATGSPSSDSAIFGQCEQTVTDECLHITVRNQVIYLGFFGDDTAGNQALNTNTWYHMGYIYDYPSLTQYVYVNGVLQVSASPKGPYKGTSGNLTIGTNMIYYPNNFWNGCIDQVAYFGQSMTASQVLNYATLTVSYSFEGNLLDGGSLFINGTGTSISYSSLGAVNESVALFGNPSYIQATGLVLLGTVGQAYSLAIWVKPSTVAGGTIIHVSAGTNGASGWCIPVLGFTSAGYVGVQSWNGGPVSITGPAINVNSWTHLATTYGSSNGIRLWINGTQYGAASGSYSFAAASTPVTVTLGSSLSGLGVCSTGVITMGQYSGYLDEFRLYSRELSSSDVLSLATA